MLESESCLPFIGPSSLAVLSLLQIFNSMMLMLAWWILGNRKNLQAKDLDNRTRKKMFINLAIIPSLYFISTGLSFLSFDVAVIFPVIMIPSLILAAKVHHKYDT